MTFQKKQIDSFIKKLIHTLLKYRQKWAAASLMLVLEAGNIAVAHHYTYKTPMTSMPETIPAFEAQTAGESLVETATESDAAEEEWKPTPGELNLAHFFPEGADRSDITKSLAGEAFKILMTRDEEWISDIYDFSDVTPVQMASRLGQPISSVTGRYNRKDHRHNRSQPETWTVNSFKNIRMTATDGDGNPVTPYSNVVEIMSMANLYTYFQGVDDYDLFLSYAQELWERSHSYSVNMSKVYYCSGCMSEEAEAKEMENLEAKAKAEAMGLAVEATPEEMVNQQQDDMVSGEEEKNNKTESGADVIDDAKLTLERRAHEASNPSPVIDNATITLERKEQERNSHAAEAETSSSVVAAPFHIHSNSGEAQEPFKAASTETGEAQESSGSGVIDDAKITLERRAYEAANPSPVLTAGGSGTVEEKTSDTSLPESEETGSDTQSGEVPDEDNAGSPSESENLPETETINQEAKPLTDCPGHVDLIIHMKIIGLDGEQNLFTIDTIGADEANFKEDGWQGWNRYTMASVRLLSSQDWFEKYGLTVSAISPGNPLTTAEIQAYMAQLPANLSDTRKEIIRFALNSVGKVPYYWGGKPSAQDYTGNHFGVLTTPDYKGRVLKGLDCSGWINWVYWSATGHRLAYEGTAGLAVLGSKIRRDQLKPGDIIVRTGADAHVIMFLGWTADGRIQCIHESSGTVNNVTIGVRDANWPYYRKLVD